MVNQFLFKNADPKIVRLVEKIQSDIKLTQFEGKVNLTGGCIRDLLLGRPVKDVDIVVEMKNGGSIFATFMAIRNDSFVAETNPVIYHNSNAAKVQLYKDVELKDIVIECIESRKHQLGPNMLFFDSAFGTIEEDAKIRDLTINAMHYNISTCELKDFNGTAIDDLANQTLRTPGDPYKVLADDPIKIMRIIRLSTELRWGIEKNTWLAMIANAKLIRKAPQEAISTELARILVAERPSFGVTKMYMCGILSHILPDIYDTTKAYECKNLRMTTFEHTLKVLDMVQPYIEHRLAALFHDVGKVVTDHDRTVSPDIFSSEVAAEDLKNMKFPKQIINSVELAIRYHRIFKIYKKGTVPPDRKIRRLMSLVGSDIGVVMDLMNANNTHCIYERNPKQVLAILDRIEELEKEEDLSNIKLPIDGNDIMTEFKLKGSPVIGILLNAVKEAYFENPNITKDECFEVVENKLKVLV